MCDLTTINLKVKTVPSADNELYFQVPFHVWIYVKSIQLLVPFSLMHGMEYTHSIFFDRVPQLQACCFMNNLKVGPQSIDDASYSSGGQMAGCPPIPFWRQRWRAGRNLNICAFLFPGNSRTYMYHDASLTWPLVRIREPNWPRTCLI